MHDPELVVAKLLLVLVVAKLVLVVAKLVHLVHIPVLVVTKLLLVVMVANLVMVVAKLVHLVHIPVLVVASPLAKVAVVTCHLHLQELRLLVLKQAPDFRCRRHSSLMCTTQKSTSRLAWTYPPTHSASTLTFCLFSWSF